MMLAYQIYPTINVVWLPLFLLLALITSLGVGLWLSAMNVQFRDIRYIIPFLDPTLALCHAHRLSQQHRAGGVASALCAQSHGGRRGGLPLGIAGRGHRSPAPWSLSRRWPRSSSLISGAYYFRRMEKTFADVV